VVIQKGDPWDDVSQVAIKNEGSKPGCITELAKSLLSVAEVRFSHSSHKKTKFINSFQERGRGCDRRGKIDR